MAASVQEDCCGSSRSLLWLPAESGHGIEGVAGHKSYGINDCFFRQLGRLADEIHGHSNTCAALEVGAEGDMLFRGDSQSVIKQAYRARGANGHYHARNRGSDRLSNHITKTAADLPGRTFYPRSFVEDSAMQQAFEIEESLKRGVDRNWDGHRIFDAWQHGILPHTRRRLCADSQGKTRMNTSLLEVEQFALDVETSAVSAQRAA
jgi:hypothetical protein